MSHGEDKVELLAAAAEGAADAESDGDDSSAASSGEIRRTVKATAALGAALKKGGKTKPPVGIDMESGGVGNDGSEAGSGSESDDNFVTHNVMQTLLEELDELYAELPVSDVDDEAFRASYAARGARRDVLAVTLNLAMKKGEDVSLAVNNMQSRLRAWAESVRAELDRMRSEEAPLIVALRERFSTTTSILGGQAAKMDKMNAGMRFDSARSLMLNELLALCGRLHQCELVTFERCIGRDFADMGDAADCTFFKIASDTHCQSEELLAEVCQAVFLQPMIGVDVLAHASRDDWNHISSHAISLGEWFAGDNSDTDLPRSVLQQIREFVAEPSTQKVLDVVPGVSQATLTLLTTVRAELLNSAKARAHEAIPTVLPWTKPRVELQLELNPFRIRVQPSHLADGCCDYPKRFSIAVPQSGPTSRRDVTDMKRKLSPLVGDFDLTEDWLGARDWFYG
jgi:hypothetical protein